MESPGEIGRADTDAPPNGSGPAAIGGAIAAPTRPEIPQWLARIAEPRNAVPILLILGIALYLVNLGGYPLYTKGEPREAVTIWDIVHGGGVILPLRAGIAIPSKPPLMHWIAALLSLAMGGVTAFTVRLPSAGFAILGLIACFFYVRRLFDGVTGLLAAAMMATTFQYLQAATGARVDMTLTFFMEIAFFEFILIAEGLTRRRMTLYLALALAVLAKGPAGLLLPAAVALVWIAAERRWDAIPRMAPIRGAIVVAIVAGGWYAAAAMVGGSAFVHKQIIAENFARFFGAKGFHEGHRHRFYYTDLALLAGFMPWTAMMPIAALRAVRAPLKLNARHRYVTIWFLTVLIFYNLAQSRRGVYLLCLYPALAAIIAIYVRNTIANPAPVRRAVAPLMRLCGAALVVIGAAALAGLALLAARPDTLAATLATMGIAAPDFVPILAAAAHERALTAVTLPIAAAAIGLLMCYAKPRIESMTAGIVAGMAAIAVAANLVVVPAIANTLSLQEFTKSALEIIGGGRVGYLADINFDFAYYSRRTIPIVTLKNPNPPDFLVAWRDLYDGLSPQKRRLFTPVMVSNPTSLDGGGELVLLRKLPPQSIVPPKPPEGYIETMAPERPKPEPTSRSL
ncbi:MAG: ArnT family glycosyltransferase [Candidatus Binataceae bacterium]